MRELHNSNYRALNDTEASMVAHLLALKVESPLGKGQCLRFLIALSIPAQGPILYNAATEINPAGQTAVRYLYKCGMPQSSRHEVRTRLQKET